MKHSFTALVDLSVLSSLACQSTFLLAGIVLAGCNGQDGTHGPRKVISGGGLSI